MDTAINILQVLSITGGVLFLLVGFVLFEDEKQNLQNRLETWWIKVRDYQTQGVTRRAAFMRVVAEGIGTILNIVYGPRLLSVRSLASAACLSISSAIFSAVIFAEFYAAGGTNWGVVLKLGFAFMAGPLVIVLFDEKHQIYVSLILLIVCGVILVLLCRLTNSDGLTIVWQVILIGAVVVIADLLLLGALRGISMLAARLQKFWHIIACMAASLAVGVLATPLPAYLAFGMNWTKEQYYAEWFMFLAFTNLFETLAALLFLFVAILMAAHWLLWPTISRLLYPLANEGFFRNRKVLCGIGLVLMAAGGKPVAGWVKELLGQL